MKENILKILLDPTKVKIIFNAFLHHLNSYKNKVIPSCFYLLAYDTGCFKAFGRRNEAVNRGVLGL